MLAAEQRPVILQPLLQLVHKLASLVGTEAEPGFAIGPQPGLPVRTQRNVASTRVLACLEPEGIVDVEAWRRVDAGGWAVPQTTG